MSEDRLQAAVEQLYGSDPSSFIEQRNALSRKAKSAGDAEAAKQIGALRRPSTAAWILNTFARANPAQADQLAELAEQLRVAQLALDGPQLRELSGKASRLIDALTRAALEAAGTGSSAVRDEVQATLRAALADPEVAAQLRSGTLAKAALWSGFGTAAPELSVVAQPRGDQREDTEVTAPRAGKLKSRPPVAETAEQRRQGRLSQQLSAAEVAAATADEQVATAERDEAEIDERVGELEALLADARRRQDDARLGVRHATAQRTKARRALEQLRQRISNPSD